MTKLWTTKFKAIAEYNFNVAKITFTLFDRVENAMGKRENADCQHFLLFPQPFLKPPTLMSTVKVLKIWACLEKG